MENYGAWSELPGGPTETKVEFAAAPLCSQMNWIGNGEVIHVPMETIPDGAIEMHGYELSGCE